MTQGLNIGKRRDHCQLLLVERTHLVIDARFIKIPRCQHSEDVCHLSHINAQLLLEVMLYCLGLLRVGHILPRVIARPHRSCHPQLKIWRWWEWLATLSEAHDKVLTQAAMRAHGRNEMANAPREWWFAVLQCLAALHYKGQQKCWGGACKANK